jgi:putative ABC transport system substrate-binding protein
MKTFFKFTVFLLAVIDCGAIAHAQVAKKIPRIGFVGQARGTNLTDPRVIGFGQKLRELGWVEGENIIIEWRFAEGIEERVPELIADLIGLKVQVMILTGGNPVRVGKKATNIIPIVMTEHPDPLREGLVASLARPGGNITGVTSFYHELNAKQLELLKEVIPKLSHVAALWQSARPEIRSELEKTGLKAKELGVELQLLGVRSPDDFEDVFNAIPVKPTVGLIVVHSQLMNSHRRQVAELAAKKRVAAIYSDRRYTTDGGLMSYGPNIPELYVRAATYVDKILKGAKPAELPVEQPMKLELVINLKAAQRIDLTIPDGVLRWADEIIK